MRYIPSRFLYAVLCLLLFAWAASGQSPQVPNPDVRIKLLEAQVATLEKQVKALRDANYLKANPGLSVKNKFPSFTVVNKADSGVAAYGCRCEASGSCQCSPVGKCNDLNCTNLPGVFGAAPNTVCQNGQCRVVSLPVTTQGPGQSVVVSGCSTGACPPARERWHPGKFLFGR